MRTPPRSGRSSRGSTTRGPTSGPKYPRKSPTIPSDTLVLRCLDHPDGPTRAAALRAVGRFVQAQIWMAQYASSRAAGDAASGFPAAVLDCLEQLCLDLPSLSGRVTVGGQQLLRATILARLVRLLHEQLVPLFALGYALGDRRGQAAIQPSELTRRRLLLGGGDLGYPGTYNYQGVSLDVFSGCSKNSAQTNVFTQASLGCVDAQSGAKALTYKDDLALNVYLATAIKAYQAGRTSELSAAYADFLGAIEGCCRYLGLGDGALAFITGRGYRAPAVPSFPYRYDPHFLCKAVELLAEAFERSQREADAHDPLGFLRSPAGLPPTGPWRPSDATAESAGRGRPRRAHLSGTRAEARTTNRWALSALTLTEDRSGFRIGQEPTH